METSSLSRRAPKGSRVNSLLRGGSPSERPPNGRARDFGQTCGRGHERAAVLAVAATALVARGALHWTTWRLPVSNDDAILLLMGRAVLHGELATTLWNQPYNGALDAYLLAPLVALLPHHGAYRLYQLVCAALLAWLVCLLGRRLGGPAAGFAGALLAAWGTPYMALMTATGPPPNFLMPLVTGFPLLLALDALAHGDERTGESPRAAGVAWWPQPASAAGSPCGTPRSPSPRSPAWPPAWRSRACGPARSRRWPSSPGFTLGVVPLAVSRLIGAAGSRVETASSAVTAAAAAVALGAGPRRPRPRARRARRPAGAPRGRRPRARRAAAGRGGPARRGARPEPRGRLPHAPRAAARGLGRGPRGRLLALAPDRSRRPALSLRRCTLRCSRSPGTGSPGCGRGEGPSRSPRRAPSPSAGDSAQPG